MVIRRKPSEFRRTKGQFAVIKRQKGVIKRQSTIIKKQNKIIKRLRQKRRVINKKKIKEALSFYSVTKRGTFVINLGKVKRMTNDQVYNARLKIAKQMSNGKISPESIVRRFGKDIDRRMEHRISVYNNDGRPLIMYKVYKTSLNKMWKDLTDGIKYGQRISQFYKIIENKRFEVASRFSNEGTAENFGIITTVRRG